MVYALMRFFITFIFLFGALSAFGQKPDDVVATATGHKWTANDLSLTAREAMSKFPALIAGARKQLLGQYLGEVLLETEAKFRGVTPTALVKLESKKVKDPLPAEVRAVYDENQSQFAGKTFEELRPQIVAFMRRDPEDKAIKKFVDSLAVKYKAAYPKDVNAAGLKPADILYSFTGGSMTVADFDKRTRLSLYNLQADFFDDLIAEAEDTVYDSLVIDEAKAQKIDAGDLVAREITSKMKDYTDAEREGLESAFRKKLFVKYNAKIELKAPPAPVQTISVDNDPSQGAATAPVTIVMFSDFQCSACSATHPILKEAMEPYADKIRFVVRDFPLETIHENGFHAALAASAANKQGKFFEYIEILYKNQKSLDDASLKKYAADLGLNAAQFALDFTSKETASEVRADMADGTSYGINGTPTIFVNGRYVRRISPDGFKEAIESALNNK